MKKEKRRGQARSGLFEEDIDVYHGSEAISSTGLRIFMKSPKKFRYYLQHGTQGGGDALDIGSALHCLVLEPEKFDSLFVGAPDINRRTKSGREDWESFCVEHKGKTVLSGGNMEMVRGMAESVLGDVLMADLMKDTQRELSARVELSNGLLVQCRPDAIKHRAILDVKTCADVGSFGYEVKRYGYHIQAAFYYFILSSIDPDRFREADFYFLAVEKSEPYEARVYGINNPSLNRVLEGFIKPTLHNLKEYLDNENSDTGTKQEIEWLNVL